MGNNIHDLIKVERKKIGVPPMYWSREMATLAQSQADYCAKVGRMVHSNRYAFQGGENLCGGKGNFSPQTIVRSWMNSKAGHREHLLSPKVTKAGVGIAKRNGKMFVAWAFSDRPPSYPDCPYYKSTKPRIKRRQPTSNISVLKWFSNHSNFYSEGKGMLRIPATLFLGFIGALGMVLGSHGLYVYFCRLEFLFGGEGDKLFMAVDIPIRLQSAVMWMSVKGLQSWFVPAAILVLGIVIWNYSGIVPFVSRYLSKWRLW